MTDVMDLSSVGGRADQFFAGRRFTGVCMVAAPLLLTAGAVLLMGIYGRGPSERVGAYAENEVRATVAVNLAMAGTVLAAFALAGVGALVAARCPRLGRAGGALAVIGLFGPAFFLGINHVGIRLGDLADRAGAGAVFQDAEATPNIVNLAGPALLVGFVLLAIGTAKAGVLPRSRSWALGIAAVAPVGLISGIVVISVVAWLALAFALAPLGRDILRAAASDR